MSQEPFLVQAHFGPHGRTVVVYGDVDMSTAPALKAAICDPLPDGATGVVVELANVRFIDSSGIAALVASRQHLDATGHRMEVRDVQPTVASVMAITGVDGYLGTTPLTA